MLQKDKLSIRRMNTNDFEIMVKWLNDEKVLEFYEEPPTNLERVMTKYGPRIEGKHYVTPCIVEYLEQSIGYIQYYEIQVDKRNLYGYSTNEKIYGIDQFIGETQLWGKGIGSSMIRIVFRKLNLSQLLIKM